MSRKVIGDAARAIYDWLLNEAIKANAAAIAPIIASGGVAVVVFRVSPQFRPAALAIGWDGVSPVFELADAERERMADQFGALGYHVSERWFRTSREGRIYLIAESGSFLVNWTRGLGYSLEPGSANEGQE